MMVLIISMLIAFVTTIAIIPYFIKFLQAAGIVGLDLHKPKKPRLPTSGGICVAFGVLFGLLFYIGINTFLYGTLENLHYILAVISSILIIMFVGFLDDINVRSKAVITKEGLDIRVGFPQWIKPLLTLPAAIPLMAINVGVTVMAIPFFGNVDFGIFYPLVIIPIFVVGASNAINLLGGFNGSEGGMGIVYLLGLGLYAFLHNSMGSIIFLIAFAALAGFIKFNWTPAKLLPGDSLTYLLGAIVASAAIVGNMEKIAIIAIAPFAIEFLLKARARFKASCLGKLRKDGKLDPPYGKKIYSITHAIMNIRPMTEKQVTIILILIELAFVIFSFLRIV